ncbi:glycerol-3-phosphate dehydrogenase/oxidase [Rhizobium wuzhouense]|uniref:Glycerol-3-phosphate dehydrogenase/oxidase n=1 Tax=Rhizobium wuzhouense TaxID=1986026 RepID=A0ABX5NP75_9HYPH|nr:glycerol-3-phosphate dehydrogenase/oxidase [Rhizobium wuzhouense]PYB71166.1 glycerol-3-phosphate dehydrogenase/oxidase [Rhizobium wuzhouense]
MRNRDEVLQQLRTASSGAAHILIVGGGINGIGLYRDLALQDVPAILIDKGDFSSGTSAAPSRLIHGGLRYLETGEFELVRESVIERNHLIRNAPHLVKPIPVWVPAFSWFGGMLSAGLRFLKLKKTPGAKGILVVKLGLVFFDRFGRKNQTMPAHRLMSKRESKRRMPGLSDKVCAVAEYYDARLVHPERLVLELVKDAERDCPQSIALPYVSLDATHGSRVRLKDEISGETFTVEPQLVINCAGAWADEVDRRLHIEKRLIGGTRGSHLIMRRPDLARQLGNGMLYFETKDFRACLVYALDTDNILLGTTDIRVTGPEEARCSDEEIDYLFDVLEQVLPGAKASRDEIVFAYSGIRPLPWSGDAATGSISRDHALHAFEPEPNRPFPVLTLVGGKWTTYRACAEQICDTILKRIGMVRRKTTLSQPIGGGRQFETDKKGLVQAIKEIVLASGLPTDIAATLYRRYGTEAQMVAAMMAGSGAKIADSGDLYAKDEIRWILRHERVTRLADIVLRRTLLPFENAITPAVIDGIATAAAGELGWSDVRRAEEIAHTTSLLTQHYRVSSLTE